MANIIYPKPGSYNDFCERNPHITEMYERLHWMAQELSLWKCTGDDVDTRTASLNHIEAKYREDFVKLGKAATRRLAEWPPVGEYEIPEDLVLPRAA
ncbi:hypothetical protein KC930_01215 [Candidatus Saccharibacteria bacterium]|nr:hypothetical protein [Candidatus Saccharibacteria bacterium]